MILSNIKLLLLLLCSEYLFAADITVEVADGTIKGQSRTTAEGNNVYSFHGIPFAQPPINELRFQAPQPPQPWTGVYDGTYQRSACYQINDQDNESEDCLFINVDTPRNPASLTSELVPVMVWIYGGGFLNGWSDTTWFGPDYIINNDVILVSFNYRVGAFGFLSTGDDVIPGNAGLKDQNLALQWVQKNIKYFGGDPEKVTIFGESAGAASVGYHILSPKSKGLFRAAILESGSSLTPWAYQRDQKHITFQTAGNIDSRFNGDDVSSSELLEFLRNQSAQTIKEASVEVAHMDRPDYIELQQGFFYAPIVEHEHEDAFITSLMYESFQSGDFNNVPIIIGINSGEALLFVDEGEYLNIIAETFDKNHALLNPLDMHLRDSTTQNAAAEEIKALYAPNGSFAENITRLIDYFNDQCFMRSIIKHAELQSRKNDVFFYQFSYTGKLAGNDESVEGFTDRVKHAEETSYIFSHVYTPPLSQYPQSDQLVLKRFTRMFTNFAKTLNPTPVEEEILQNVLWPKVNPIYFPYMEIGSYSRVKLHPRERTYSSWDSIYDKYAEKPYDTY